jgi:hypothetical protein
MVDQASGDVRVRLWVAGVSGVLAAILLFYFAHRVYAETASYAAYRAGTLASEPAEVMDAEYYSGTGGYAGGNAQEVTFRLHSGGERSSLVRVRDRYLDVEKGNTVRLGMWHGHLVTVEGAYVRTPWTPGASLVFVLLPPAFVLAVLQCYRLLRSRRERPELLPNDNSSVSYISAAGLLAFGTGLVMLLIQDVPWSAVPAFVVSALGPLTWFTVREIRLRRSS